MNTINAKIVILGDAGVGKSSLLGNLMSMPFNQEYPSTIGVEYGSKMFGIEQIVQAPDPDSFSSSSGNSLPSELKQCVFKGQYWDTAGQERFRSIIASYYRGVNGVMFVCDMTNRRSFENLQFWIGEFRKHTTTPMEWVSAIIVGNKADLKSDWIVTEDDMNKLSEQYQIPYYLVSAKNDVDKVPEVFKILNKMILHKMIENPVKQKREPSIEVYDHAPSKWCCM